MTCLSIKDVSVQLGSKVVLEDISLDVAEGEVLGLIGPNGVGKTTLLRCIAGLLKPHAGEIYISGHLIKMMDVQARARAIAYLAQNCESQWHISVDTLVGLGRLPYQQAWKGLSQQDHDAIQRALEVCDITQYRKHSVSQLSGGERSRVMLARALATESQLLLVDEPVANLDPSHQLDVMTTLAGIAASGGSVVCVMHDLTLAARYCHRLALLFDQHLVALGDPQQVLSTDNLAQYYNIRAFCQTVEGSRVVIPLKNLNKDARSGTLSS